jgi:hypothetical protein
VHQAKYTKDIVRKFKMEDAEAMTTQMSTTIAHDADEEGEHVDQKEYRSMIGSLLYLTAMKPDIQFSVCLCARFQASPRTSHRQAVKRIFRYLCHTPDFGLWYFASSSLALHGFSDADFAGCRLDRKSTSGTCQFLGSSLVSWSSHKLSSSRGFQWFTRKPLGSLVDPQSQDRRTEDGAAAAPDRSDRWVPVRLVRSTGLTGVRRHSPESSK